MSAKVHCDLCDAVIEAESGRLSQDTSRVAIKLISGPIVLVGELRAIRRHRDDAIAVCDLCLAHYFRNPDRERYAVVYEWSDLDADAIRRVGAGETNVPGYRL